MCSGFEVGDELELGVRRFRIEAVLAYEPDRGGDLFSIAPRLMMHLDNVPATKLVQPGSRVTHAVLFAGDPTAVEAYKQAVEPELEEREHFHGVKDARPENAGGVGTRRAVPGAGSARQRHAGGCGYRSLVTALCGPASGCSGHHALSWRQPAGDSADYSFQVLTLGLDRQSPGVCRGLSGATASGRSFRGLAGCSLPAPSLNPVAIGVMTGSPHLGRFCPATHLATQAVPPARVLRRELGQIPAATWTAMLAPLLALAVLILWQAKDLQLALYVIGGALASVAVLALGALLLVRMLRGLRGRVGVAFRFGLSNITRRASSSVLQGDGFWGGYHDVVAAHHRAGGCAR